MKPIPETASTFDRTSTREELFKVIELLSAMRPIHGLTPASRLGGTDIDISGPQSDKELQFEAKTTDDELAMVAEIGPLAEVFPGKPEFIN